MTHRESAIKWAKEVLALNPVFLDVETTGTDREAEILSVSIIGKNLRYSSYVKPKKCIDITSKSFEVNGITQERVNNAPPFEEVWEVIYPRVAYGTVCTYNAEFDGRMIAQEVRRCKNKQVCFDYWKCAMKAYAEYVGEPKGNGYRNWKLTEACEQMGIEYIDPHSSLADTFALVRLVKAMAEGDK